MDPHTGFIRFGFRDYDPATGRFTARDPMGDTGGDHDLYDYCVDDPVSFVDPQGLAAEKVEEQSNALQRLLCEYYSILACPPGSPKQQAFVEHMGKEAELWGRGMLLYRHTFDHPVYEGAKFLFPEIKPDFTPRKK